MWCIVTDFTDNVDVVHLKQHNSQCSGDWIHLLLRVENGEEGSTVVCPLERAGQCNRSVTLSSEWYVCVWACNLR